MGVVQSFLKGRRPREKNRCSVASSLSIRRILKSQNGSCAKLSERADTSKKFGVLLKNCAKLSERADTPRKCGVLLEVRQAQEEEHSRMQNGSCAELRERADTRRKFGILLEVRQA
jgi:hypothetical protein